MTKAVEAAQKFFSDTPWWLENMVKAVLEAEREYEYGIGWNAEHGVWNPKKTAEEAVEAMEYQKAHYPGDKPYYALKRVKATNPGPWEHIS